MTRRMMLDVESVGLQGEAIAYGFVIEDGGRVIEEGFAIANPLACSGERQDFDWLKANVFPWINAMSPVFPSEGGAPIIQNDPTTGVLVTFCDGPVSLRETFWSLWERERVRETQLWADVCWPVEANFLSSCVRAKTGRKFRGPYPLMDAATLWRTHCGGTLLRQPKFPERMPAVHERVQRQVERQRERVLPEREARRMKLPFLSDDEWRWRWQQKLSGRGQSILHRVVSFERKCTDEDPGCVGVVNAKAACGLEADYMTMPGIFSRMGAQRCKKCCKALGIPAGDAARPRIREYADE